MFNIGGKFIPGDGIGVETGGLVLVTGVWDPEDAGLQLPSSSLSNKITSLQEKKRFAEMS